MIIYVRYTCNWCPTKFLLKLLKHFYVHGIRLVFTLLILVTNVRPISSFNEFRLTVWHCRSLTVWHCCLLIVWHCRSTWVSYWVEHCSSSTVTHSWEESVTLRLRHKQFYSDY